MVDAAPMVSITEHLRDAYGFTMKSTANGFLFRVLPLRDPDQHRFWCVVVVRVLPGGDADRSHPAWIGRRGLRREELAEIMAAIRGDLEAWLADPARKTLLDWIVADAVTEEPGAGPLPSPERAVVTKGFSGTDGTGSADGSPHLNGPSYSAGAGVIARAVA